MLIHVNYPAWYTVTSADGEKWYATLASFKFNNTALPEKLIFLRKDLYYGWLCYSVKFNENNMEEFTRLPDAHPICIGLIHEIELYIMMMK
jgi:hypothetical protein